MIFTDIVTINGKFFVKNKSDLGMMIERDGELYSEAIDPIGEARTYTETAIPIEQESDDNSFEIFSSNP